jgi:hypothetical protein
MASLVLHPVHQDAHFRAVQGPRRISEDRCELGPMASVGRTVACASFRTRAKLPPMGP